MIPTSHLFRRMKMIYKERVFFPRFAIMRYCLQEAALDLTLH